PPARGQPGRPLAPRRRVAPSPPGAPRPGADGALELQHHVSDRGSGFRDGVPRTGPRRLTEPAAGLLRPGVLLRGRRRGRMGARLAEATAHGGAHAFGEEGRAGAGADDEARDRSHHGLADALELGAARGQRARELLLEVAERREVAGAIAAGALVVRR